MDGLRYILKEIEARRTLLHDFVKGIETSGEFTLFSGGIPDFVKDGELIYRPTSESEPLQGLTVEDFNASHKRQFRDLRQWSRLSIPLGPGEPIPAHYEINEVLAYELGEGHCNAHILMQLWSPSLQQPDRWFYVYVEHRHIPKQRYPEKVKIDVRKLRELLARDNPRFFEAPSGESIPEYRDGVTITRGVYLYKWWKEDARKARPRLNPTENEAECGGSAIWVEGNKIFTAPIIVIDEKTTGEHIWGQLLIYACGHGYFNEAGEAQVYEELSKLLIKFKNKPDPEVLSSATTTMHEALLHFQKHTFSPYNEKSNLAYLGMNLKGYSKNVKLKSLMNMKSIESIPEGKEALLLPQEDLEITLPINKQRSHVLNQVFKNEEYSDSCYTVYQTFQKTGIPRRTIYHLVKTGKIKATRNKKDFIALDRNAIDEIEQLATRKEKHEQIRELAKLKGKSRPAIKKWLQRHRDLPEEKFNKELSLWLKVRQP